MPLFADLITQKLSANNAESIHRYLVIDMAAAQGIRLDVFTRLTTTATDLLAQQICNWEDTASPVLIGLRAHAYSKKDLDRLREELNKWRYANNLLYIESTLDHASMTRALYARTQAQLTENMSVMLRYFDTRVFNSLMQILSSEQHQAFLSAGLNWIYTDRSGQAQQVQCANFPDAFAAPLVLNDQQETQLMLDAEPDHIIGILLDQNNSALLEMTPPEQYRRIKTALDGATSLNIDQLSEQVAYCCINLELGGQFHQQATWTELLPQVRSKQMQFSQLVQQLAQKELAA
jgi:Domain of unknown function (DUF4123)